MRLVLLLLALACMKLHAQNATVQRPVPNILYGSDFLGAAMGSFPMYDVVFDSLGYAICCGPVGFTRFDGFKGHLIDRDTSLIGKAAVALHKGRNNRIWAIGKLFIAYYDGERFTELPIPDSIKQHFYHGVEFFHEAEDGTVHLSSRFRGRFRITPDGQFHHDVKREDRSHRYVISHLDDGTPFFYSIKTDAGFDSLEIFYERPWGELHLITKTAYANVQHLTSLVEREDGVMLFAYGDRAIIQFSRDSLIQIREMDDSIIGLFEDSKKRLWIGTNTSGLRLALDDDLRAFDRMGEMSCRMIGEDELGGLWCSMSKQGFGHIAPPNIPHISDKSGFAPFKEIEHVTGNDSVMYCLNAQQRIYERIGDTIRELAPIEEALARVNQRGISSFESLEYDEGRDILWAGFPELMAYWKDGKWTKIPHSSAQKKMVGKGVRDLFITEEGQVYGCTSLEVFTIVDDQIVVISKPHRILRDLVVHDDGSIWIGASDGLWVLEDSNFVRPDFDMPSSLLENVLCIESSLGSIWAQGAPWKGFFRITGKHCERLLDSHGDEIMPRSMSTASDGSLWASSYNNRGTLLKFTTSGLETQIEEFQFDDRASWDIPSNGLLATREKIFWGCPFGLFIANRSELLIEDRRERAVIDEVRINHELRPNRSSYDLEYDQNTLSFEFGSLSFRREPLKYRYRLVGLDSTWFTTSYRQIQFTNLDPGDYTFMLQSRIMQVPWSEAKTVSFHVAAPYWETLWFRITMGLLLILSVLAFVQFRSRQIRALEAQKSKTALEMSRLEMRAIKAQLNPHFIFNSITSVMYFLSKNRAEDAELYLHRFSRIIRTVLDNSEKSTIPLSEELELMRHYVSLESERFKGSGIDFQVELRGVNEEDILIPPALFQPYIENAIWHGLQHKEGDRKITLIIIREGSLLDVRIEDNGIGRKASAQMGTSRDKERSYGMMIASRRIEAFNLGSTAGAIVTDLEDEHGNPTGTRVSFKIPLHLNKAELNPLLKATDRDTLNTR